LRFSVFDDFDGAGGFSRLVSSASFFLRQSVRVGLKGIRLLSEIFLKSFESGMDKHTQGIYQFDDFSLDVSRKSLWRAGRLVALTPKAFETLLVLVKHKGAVVEKKTLLNEVWADTFVEEATLAQNISTVRKILGSKPDKQFIETIPRRGYRFVAEVREVAVEEFSVVENLRRMPFVAAPRVSNSNSIDSPIARNGKNNHSAQAETAAASPNFFQARRGFISKNKRFAGIVLVCLAVAAVGWAVSRAWLNSDFADSKFKEIRFTKLTSGDFIVHTAVSPDGKYLASVNRQNGNWSLQVRQISSENSVEVVAPAPIEFIGLTFSRDSQSIYYAAYPKDRLPNGTRIGTLYKIPLLGGVPEPLLTDIDSPVTFAPDNRQLAFLRNSFKDNESAIIVAGFDGRPERKLAVRPMNKYFSPAGPAWSPDGKTLSCGANNSGISGSQMELLTIDAQSGETKSLIAERLQWIGKTAWLEDGSGIIYPAFFSNSQNLTDQIWIASFPGGQTRLVTNGISGLRGMSITSDSNSFVTLRSSRSTGYWIQSTETPEAPPERIKQNFSEISLVPQGMTLLPEKKIVFDSTRNGNSDIWVMNLDGSNSRQLTSDPQADYAPEISPDGKFIIFLSNRDGAANLWRANTDGTDVRKVTESPFNLFSSVSTDGKFAYYSQRIGEDIAPTLWKVPVEGGAPVQLTDKAGFNPKVSPDGKLLACFYAAAEGFAALKLSVVSADSGELLKQFDVTYNGVSPKTFWSRDGQSIFFLKTRDEISTIYRQPLDSDTPVKVIESKTDPIFRFALSGDDRLIAYESGSLIQEVILVENVE
jgi:eukaryotic-like serine/threonine-protein kinase